MGRRGKVNERGEVAYSHSSHGIDLHHATKRCHRVGVGGMTRWYLVIRKYPL